LELDEALQTPDEEIVDSRYEEFILAASERTNVKDQRETRIEWFCKAYKSSLN
jgi:hypothetical protein